MSVTVAIENAALEWIDVTALIDELTDGTDDADQVVPEITISLRRLPTDPDLVNPSVNKHRARIRVTEGGDATYYLMERPQGSIVRSLDSKNLYGRAWAGVLDDLRPVSYEWPEDTLCSVICAQIAHQDVVNQGGITVAVRWQASIDPMVPGGRYSVSRADRRAVIAEVARMCGAKVRTSLDGLGLEVYDVPARDGSEPVVRRYTDGIAPLNYELRRVEQIANAVRVQGEVLNYTRPSLPVVRVTLVPGDIEADGSDQASAVARVYDSGGNPVQHKAIVDEAISAGSYTQIPVSGCFAVDGVWLNTGTQDSPVKGANVAPTGFDASAITVPDNGTQLFIVSYTQAESVSWSSADVQRQIDGEAHATSGLLAVATSYAIGTVRGVYRATDTNRSGTNYYTGGSATAGGTSITLGISPGPAGTAVIVDYDQYEATPAVNISPATSLCDAEGKARTTVGAGTSVGTIAIVASALGQSGSANLSLTGDAVGALTVTADPQTIRAKQSATATTEFSSEACETADDNGNPYVTVANKVTYCGSVLVSGYGEFSVIKWTNDEVAEEYRIYLNGTVPAGVNASATYKGIETIDEADQEATITATVLTSAGESAADGTEVKFELLGATGGATLSATQQTTSGGTASVTLTAGSEAEFYVQVTSGPYRAKVLITVTNDPLASEQVASTTDGEVSDGLNVSDPQQTDKKDEEKKTELDEDEYVRADGRICRLVLKDWEDDSGNIHGRRQIVDCDGKPKPFVDVIINGDTTVKTDAEGYFSFSVAAAGSHDVEVEGTTASFDVAAGGDMRWTPGSSDRWYEVCRDPS